MLRACGGAHEQGCTAEANEVGQSLGKAQGRAMKISDTRLYQPAASAIQLNKEVRAQIDAVFEQHIKKSDEREELRRVRERLEKEGGMTAQEARILAAVRNEIELRNGDTDWIAQSKRERAKIIRTRALAMCFPEGKLPIASMERASRRFFEKIWPILSHTP